MHGCSEQNDARDNKLLYCAKAEAVDIATRIICGTRVSGNVRHSGMGSISHDFTLLGTIQQQKTS